MIRAYVKGAPDELLKRSTRALMPGGASEPLTEEMRAMVLAENVRIASQGKRVLGLAQRELDPRTFDPSGDLMAMRTFSASTIARISLGGGAQTLRPA